VFLLYTIKGLVTFILVLVFSAKNVEILFEIFVLIIYLSPLELIGH